MNPNYNNSLCKVIFEESWHSYNSEKAKNLNREGLIFQSELGWNVGLMTTINRALARMSLPENAKKLNCILLLSEISIADMLDSSFAYGMIDYLNENNLYYKLGNIRGYLSVGILLKEIFPRTNFRKLILEKSNMKAPSDRFLLLYCKNNNFGIIINLIDE